MHLLCVRSNGELSAKQFCTNSSGSHLDWKYLHATSPTDTNMYSNAIALHCDQAKFELRQRTYMTATFETESTLTDRYQTTVPATVRRALQLGKRDKIHYRIRPDGEVVLTRADRSDEADPVLASFLRFIENDINANPGRPTPMTPAFMRRVNALVEGIDVDLDVPLTAHDD